MSTGPPERPPTPLYLAFERVEHKRNMQTMERYKVLHEDPGLAHVLDAASTREGDPWRRYGVGPALRSREPMFYDHGGPRAACGRSVLVALPAEYDPEDPDACPECAELVRTDKARNRFGQYDPYRNEACGDAVRIQEDDEVSVYECRLRWRHHGPHEGQGATWETGPEDFTPPPDGYV